MSSTVADPPRLSTLVGLGALLLAPFMGVLDVFIVNVAAPSISRDLGSRFDDTQLVIGGYMLAFAMGLVTGGRLGDTYGRRRLFLIGLSCFAATSLACAAAPTTGFLVTARVLQGLSAALMFPQVLAMVQTVVAPERRALVLGFYGASQSVGAICGQVFGGLLVQLDFAGLGWRGIFLVNLPMCALAWLGTFGAIPRDASTQRRGLDLIGVALLSAALLLLLYPVVVGAQQGWPTWTWAAMAASPVAAAGFAWWERRLSASGGLALLPPRLFRIRGFSHGVPAALALYTGNAGFYIVLAFFLQDGLGMSSFRAAMEFVPLGVSFALASLASGPMLARFGGRALRAGALVIVAGLLMLASAVIFARGSSLAAALEPGLVLCGIGQGLVVPSVIGAVMRRVDDGDAGAAAGGLLTTAQTGNALGVAIVGALFSSMLMRGNSYGLAFGLSMIVLCGIALALYSSLVRLTARDA